jgi:hypothetical protein
VRYIVLDCRHFRPLEGHLLNLLSIYRDMGMKGVILQWGRYFPWSFDERLSSRYAYPEEVICGLGRRCRDLGLELINDLPCIEYEQIIAGHPGFTFLLSIKKDEGGFRKFIQSYLNFTEELITDFFNLLGGGVRIYIDGAKRFSPAIESSMWLNELLYPLLEQLEARKYRPLFSGFQGPALGSAVDKPEIGAALAELPVDVLYDVPGERFADPVTQQEGPDGSGNAAVPSGGRLTGKAAGWYRLLFPAAGIGSHSGSRGEEPVLPAKDEGKEGARAEALGSSVYELPLSPSEPEVCIVLPDPALLPAGCMKYQPREASLRPVHTFFSTQLRKLSADYPAFRTGPAVFLKSWEDNFAAAESLMSEIAVSLEGLRDRMWAVKALLARATVDAEERSVLGPVLAREEEELRQGISRLSDSFAGLRLALEQYVHARSVELFIREHLMPLKEDFALLSGRIELIL